jgi:hypothetical protein
MTVGSELKTFLCEIVGNGEKLTEALEIQNGQFENILSPSRERVNFPHIAI